MALFEQISAAGLETPSHSGSLSRPAAQAAYGALYDELRWGGRFPVSLLEELALRLKPVFAALKNAGGARSLAGATREGYGGGVAWIAGRNDTRRRRVSGDQVPDDGWICSRGDHAGDA